MKRAYFHAKAKRFTYVALPPEDMFPGEEGMCGRRIYSMYGTRDAAANWAEEHAGLLFDIGFKAGGASPCVFVHEGRRLKAYVHGDDFVVSGKKEDRRWLRLEMEKKYGLIVEAFGPDKDECKEVRVLNMIFRWTKEGVQYEADPRHVEIMLKQLNIGDCKAVVTLGTKEEGMAKPGDTEQSKFDDQLNETKTTAYRALVARANYLSPDRPDISFAVEGLARGMSRPLLGDWNRLKRLARYLKGKPRGVINFAWQRCADKVSVYSDADWAGDKVTRKSTIGGCIMIGRHAIKIWSKIQAVIALSSCESELYAFV